jgi:FMN phosphatase YigB (HAD superfamily)
MPPSPTPLRFGVLFDVGYTLLDEFPRLDGALQWTSGQLEAAGKPITPPDLHHAYLNACAAPDPDERSLLVQTLVSLGIPREQAADIRKRLPWDAAPMQPYPDAPDALRHLHAGGVKLGVLANQPPSASDDLKRANLLGFFDDVWLSESVGLSKPDPAFFRLALSVWSIPPVCVAYVGDRPDNDTAPARRLGLYTVRVTRGPHARQPESDATQRPDFTAPNLLAAAHHLRAWAESHTP